MSALRPPSRIVRRLLWAALGVVVVWGGWTAWRRFQRAGAAFDPGMVEAFLDTRLATLTDSVYRVRMGTLHFDVLRRAARIDSVVITTDTARNGWLVHPYPVIRVVLAEAEVRGVGPGPDGRGIVIDEIRFAQVVASLTFAPGDGGARARVADQLPAIVSWTAPEPQEGSQIAVTRILLQGISATLHPPPGSTGRDQHVEHLSVVLDSVRADPRPESARFPILVHDIRVLLSDFAGGWDSASTVSVAQFEGSFRDSTLRALGLGLHPTKSIGEVLRRNRKRRDRITVTADSVTARGVDWRTALRDGAVPIRALRVDGADLLVYSDHRLARRVWTGPPKPILQETLRKFGRPIMIDTVELRRARVRYQERTSGGDGMVGEVAFEDIDGRLTGLRWRPDSQTGAVIALNLRAKAWGAGPMSLSIRGSADSPIPRAEIDLFVGAMPLSAVNQFASHVAPFEISGGTQDSLRAHVSLTDDHATGEVRPYYHDLSIRARGGAGGFFHRLGRSAKTMIANSFVIRDDNPDRDGTVSVGRIDRDRTAGQTFWPFLWISIRGGLVPVVVGRGVDEE